MNLKPQDAENVKDFSAGSLALDALSKDALIELHRKAYGKVGDTARNSKADYLAKLVGAFNMDELRAFAADVAGTKGDGNFTMVPVASDAPASAAPIAAAMQNDPRLQQAAAVLQGLFGGFDEAKVRGVVEKAVAESTTQALAKANEHAATVLAESRQIATAVGTASQSISEAESRVRDVITNIESKAQEALAKAAREQVGQRVEVVLPDGKTADVGIQHREFPRLLQYVGAGLNVWLPGPAGSGKTTAARHVAKALAAAGMKDAHDKPLPFYHTGKVLLEHQLVGYMDAHGKYVETVFYRAYRDGGVFLQDEADGSEAKALLALNMAIENGEMAFPCGIVKRHPNFRLIAAANTWGQGGDHDYVGRNKLDAAFLDRFVFLAWGYDEAFELKIAGDRKWTQHVQKLRANAKAKGVKVLITPRASILGAELLKAGASWDDAEAATIRKGMTDEQWRVVKG